jgi:hypothetical protein
MDSAAELGRSRLDRLNILVRKAEMMADLMNQDMGHDNSESILPLAPEVEQGPAVEPDHVGQGPGLRHRRAMGDAASAKQSKQVEFGLRAHFLKRFLVREIDDLDDQALAKLGESFRQSREGSLGEALDVGGRRRDDCGPIFYWRRLAQIGNLQWAEAL